MTGLLVTLYAHGLPQLFHQAETDADAEKARADFVGYARAACHGAAQFERTV